MRRFAVVLFVLLTCAITGACVTTIGAHNPEVLVIMQSKKVFGDEQALRLCGLLDRGISEDEARSMLDRAWNNEEGKHFGLRIELVKSTPWQRNSFATDGIFKDVWAKEIDSSCDRVFAFVGRRAGDIFYGLTFMPEVWGRAGFTHGYAVVRLGSIQQMLLAPPMQALKHELWHLVGCGHDHIMNKCYETVANLKAKRVGQDAFFPAILESVDTECKPRDPFVVTTREMANNILAKLNAVGNC